MYEELEECAEMASMADAGNCIDIIQGGIE